VGTGIFKREAPASTIISFWIRSSVTGSFFDFHIAGLSWLSSRIGHSRKVKANQRKAGTRWLQTMGIA